MRTHLSSVTAAARVLSQRDAWRSRWLEFSALVILSVVLVTCFQEQPGRPPVLAPLPAVPPALAGIGADSVRRPLTNGAVSPRATIAVKIRPIEYASWL